MADETSPDPTPDREGATPNRDRRREPPIIEGVARAEEAGPNAAEPEPARAEPEPAAPASDDGVETASAQSEAKFGAEPPSPPPAAEAQRASGRPVLSAVIGAIVGAIVAAAGIGALLPRGPDPQVVARLDALEHSQALAALDKRVAALETGAAALDANGRRLTEAALNAKASADSSREAQSAAQAARADAAKALAAAQAARDDAAKAQSAAAAPAPASGQTPAAGPTGSTGTADVAALEARIGKLESDLAALSHASGTPDFGALEARIAKLEAATPSPAPAASDLGPLESRVGKLETDLAVLSRLPAALDPISQRLEKLEQALAAPKTENRVAAEATSPKRDAAGLAVVAEALRMRLAAGAPFPLEAAALERLGADPAKLAVLKPLADKGAPSAATLAADFARAAPAALAAAAPEKSGGVFDRLFANVGKVVKVTPVGEIAGDDPVALVSQINAALARADIASALATWKRLPDSAREASKGWADEAGSALAAAKAAQGVAEDAMARLAAAGN